MKEKLVSTLLGTVKQHNLKISNKALRILKNDINNFIDTYRYHEQKQKGFDHFTIFMNRIAKYTKEKNRTQITEIDIKLARKQCGLIFWCNQSLRL